MAIHSSILVWRIPWTEEPGGLQFIGLLESDMPEATLAHSSQKYKSADIFSMYSF